MCIYGCNRECLFGYKVYSNCTCFVKKSLITIFLTTREVRVSGWLVHLVTFCTAAEWKTQMVHQARQRPTIPVPRAIHQQKRGNASATNSMLQYRFYFATLDEQSERQRVRLVSKTCSTMVSIMRIVPQRTKKYSDAMFVDCSTVILCFERNAANF